MRLKKIDLSKSLGSDRKTIDRYLNLKGAPKPDKAKCYDLDEVREWCRTKGAKLAEGDNVLALRAKKLKLECERITEGIQQSKFDFAARRSEFVPMTEIRPIITSSLAEFTANLRAKFEFEMPPRYVGKNEIECAQLNIEGIRFVIQRLKAGFEKLASE